MHCRRTLRKSKLAHQHHSPRAQTSSGIKRKLMVLLSSQSRRRQNQMEQHRQQGTRPASRSWKQQTMFRAKQMQRQILAAASGSLQVQVQAHQLRQGMLQQQLDTPPPKCQGAQRGIQGRLR